MFSARIIGYAAPLLALLLSSTFTPKTHAANIDSATLETRPTLADAWLALDHLPAGRAYYLLDRDQETLAQQGRQLNNELIELIDQAAKAGNQRQWQGLVQWQLKLRQPATLRTVAKAALVDLLATPRSAPALASLAGYGSCLSSNWIDIWTPTGMTRLDWQERSRLSNTLRRLPKADYRAADTAVVITPGGTIQRRGIAAWNLQDAALAPGSRIVLPLPPTSVSARWVNENLPSYLAARIPSDDCTSYSMEPDDVSAP